MGNLESKLKAEYSASMFWLNIKKYFKILEANTFGQRYYTQELFTTSLEICRELVIFLKNHLNC